MIKKINYSLLFVAILLARDSIKGASIGDAIALASVVALYGYSLYLKHKQEKQDETMRNDIESLRRSVDGLKIAKALTRSV